MELISLAEFRLSISFPSIILRTNNVDLHPHDCRYLYRRNKKGITAKLDDDLLKFYCNEDTFLMQVTAIELEGLEGQDSIMYDITLCEI